MELLGTVGMITVAAIYIWLIIFGLKTGFGHDRHNWNRRDRHRFLFKFKG